MRLFTFVVYCLASLFWNQYAFAQEKIIRHFKTNEKVVFLTFDDGPDVPYTAQILDVLKQQNVKATFFVLGNNAATHPNLIKRIMLEGHGIGNHSLSHKHLKKYSTHAIVNDIQKTDLILENLGVKQPIPFRAPFGQTSANMRDALNQLHKPHVLFNFLPQDWTRISADKIYEYVQNRLKPGLIITLHDGGKRRQQTVIATQMIIERLRAQGYEFALVNDYL